MRTVIAALLGSAGVLSGCGGQERPGAEPTDVEIVAGESHCLEPHIGPPTARIVLRNRAAGSASATIELTAGAETLSREVTVPAEGRETVVLTLPAADPCVARVLVGGRAGPDVRLPHAIE